MKIALALVVVAAVALSAAAFDLGTRAPAKPNIATNPPPPDPEVIRQGGDTIADAVSLTIPTNGITGSTAGFTDDYDEVCPYADSTSPDVVYSFRPDADMALDIDLCGSSYDTKIYIYDENLALIACNDDYYVDGPCGDYVSRLERVPVSGGGEYFLVIDGYGGDSGDYVLDLYEWHGGVLECPVGVAHEDEPPLEVDYEDQYNGGCDADPAAPLIQPITEPEFCGVSGYYLYQGQEFRDTDWFVLEIPSSGVLQIVGDAEHRCFMLQLGPQDCDAVGVLQSMVVGPCYPQSMSIVGDPGSPVWLWVGPVSYASPGGNLVEEFLYTLFWNPDVIATEERSWTAVKALFD